MYRTRLDDTQTVAALRMVQTLTPPQSTVARKAERLALPQTGRQQQAGARQHCAWPARRAAPQGGRAQQLALADGLARVLLAARLVHRKARGAKLPAPEHAAQGVHCAHILRAHNPKTGWDCANVGGGLWTGRTARARARGPAHTRCARPTRTYPQLHTNVDQPDCPRPRTRPYTHATRVSCAPAPPTCETPSGRASAGRFMCGPARARCTAPARKLLRACVRLIWCPVYPRPYPIPQSVPGTLPGKRACPACVRCPLPRSGLDW